MEDKIDKLYDLIEKMYSNLSGKVDNIEKMYSNLSGKVDNIEKMNGSLSGKIDNVESNLTNRLNKIELTQEQGNSKLQLMTEIQQSHYDENKRSHKEILGKLEKIGIATLENEAELYNLKKAK